MDIRCAFIPNKFKKQMLKTKELFKNYGLFRCW